MAKGTGTAPLSLADRFWPKVDRDNGPTHPVHGRCWIWARHIHPTGYGQFKYPGGKSVHAHRVAWELEHGPPGDLWVLHKCDNPPCVRPDHLFLGTVLDNTRDMWAKGRAVLADWIVAKAGQTHCIRGHAFTPENTRIRRADGTGRHCRACDATKARANRAAATAAGCSLDKKYRPGRNAR